MNDRAERLRSEIHVWTASTDAMRAEPERAAWEKWLSPDERARWLRYRRPEDRDLFVFARALLRRSLSRYADVDPSEWRFGPGPGGRPELADPFASLDLRFNLSHTPGLIACLVSGPGDAGVDVEGRDRVADVQRLARTVCADEERRGLEGLPPDEARSRFMTLWTLKEAYLKARGTGLTLPPSRVAFSTDTDGRVSVSFHEPVSDDPDAWSFRVWRPSTDHVGAVAFRRNRDGERSVHFR